MRPRIATVLLLAAGALGLAGAPAARAAELQVNPVLVSLGASARSGMVTLRNAGSAPVRLEVQVRGWAQGPGGEMVLSPTEDVVAYPPLLALEPGEERNVRVGAVVGPGAAERSYRVFIQELPAPAPPGGPAQLRVVSRIGIPVFLAPERVRERAAVRDLAVAHGRATFRLRNEGTVRVRPASVKLVATTAAGGAVLERELDAWYVLAGGERVYEVELPSGACAPGGEVSVAVTLDREVLRGHAPAAGGCGS